MQQGAQRHEHRHDMRALCDGECVCVTAILCLGVCVRVCRWAGRVLFGSCVVVCASVCQREYARMRVCSDVWAIDVRARTCVCEQVYVRTSTVFTSKVPVPLGQGSPINMELRMYIHLSCHQCIGVHIVHVCVHDYGRASHASVRVTMLTGIHTAKQVG